MEGAPNKTVWMQLRACGVLGVSRRPLAWREESEVCAAQPEAEVRWALASRGKSLDVIILFQEH